MLYSVDYACWLFSWFHIVIFQQFHFFNSFNYVVSQRENRFFFNFLPILLRFELLSFAILIIFYPNRCFGPSGRTSKMLGQIKGGKFTISISSVPTEHFISPSVWLCHYTNLPVFQLFWPPWLQSSLHLWLTNACCPCPRWRALTTQWRNTSSWWRRQKNALRDWMPKVSLVSWLLKLTELTDLSLLQVATGPLTRWSWLSGHSSSWGRTSPTSWTTSRPPTPTPRERRERMVFAKRWVTAPSRSRLMLGRRWRPRSPSQRPALISSL